MFILKQYSTKNKKKLFEMTKRKRNKITKIKTVKFTFKNFMIGYKQRKL